MDEGQWSLKLKNFLNISIRTLSLGMKIFLGFCTLFLGVFVWGYTQIPSDKEIRSCMITKMHQVDLCPTSSQYVKLSQISNYLQKSVVLTEDSAFWDHQGFDLNEMQNSLKSNLEKGKFVRGGSTITQQLAKNMFLSKAKTLTRKSLEAIITVRLEKNLKKGEILERYLNVVQFGENIYGVKAAANFYFKKTPANLDLLESAFLTFLLPSPEVYSKSFFKRQLTPFALQRVSQIIERLYLYQRVSEEEYLSAKANLEIFLTGREAPIIDPELDKLSEEAVERELLRGNNPEDIDIIEETPAIEEEVY
jgi:monofunctional biosynthetic peptidoglycan transglycosylase